MKRLLPVKSLLPRSLAAQMLVLLGAALLVAQLVNFALILNERQKLSLAQNEGPAITRYAQVAGDLKTAVPDLRGAFLTDASQRFERFALSPESGVADAARESRIEERLADALTDRGVAAITVRAGFVEERRSDGPPRRRLILSSQQADKTWLVGRMPVPRGDEWLVPRLAAATLLVYVIVLGASAWIAFRLARPLRDLTRAANAFGGRGAPVTVAPSGPDDLRQAITAFNAMNRRVVALLDDKDRMLGALGHDLRTPLASLRIRVDSMEPEDEREAAIAKIAEMSDMLEEILVLARAGRAREPAKKMDVTALVETLIEDQRELGRPAEMVSHGRIVAEVQPGPLRRAVTNLVDNAIKYGGSARASVAGTPSGIEIRIADAGPGLTDEELQRVFDPFYRVEGSRNRETGGTGLGLAIARAIAESHGGTLRLERGDPGLVAVLTLPVDPAAA